MMAWLKTNLGLLITLTVTLIYLLGVMTITDLSSFQILKLNEKGDVLAGIFSPLAFLWLVYGYLQQGQELKLNTKALEMQAQELIISNQSLEQQVMEMKKSVQAQQEMFELAEKQYLESRYEKIKSSTPQIQLIGSKYKREDPYRDGNFQNLFNVTIQAENLTIRNLNLKVSSWCVAKTGAPKDKSCALEINTLNVTQSEVLFFYNETNVDPFNNDHIYINYYDERGNKYYKAYEITMNDDSYIILKEKVLAP